MVSVIMPAYNREKVIYRAIKSVLEQTYTDLELIVVDDGSTDDTRKIIEAIKDPRLKYFYQSNSGACKARNHGIEKASGEYIAFHDSDDIWHKDKLEKQMKVFDINQNVDLVFCKLVQYLDSEQTVEIPEYCSEGIVDPVSNLFGIGTQTIIGKKEVFKFLRFDDEMPRFQEFELLLRIVKDHKIYCLSEGLVDYFIGADSISGNPYKLLLATQLLLKKHPDFIETYPIMAKLLSERLQLEAKRAANKKDAYMPYLKQAAKYNLTLGMVIKIILGYLKIYPVIIKS